MRAAASDDLRLASDRLTLKGLGVGDTSEDFKPNGCSTAPCYDGALPLRNAFAVQNVSSG
jgi:hypothetical protein